MDIFVEHHWSFLNDCALLHCRCVCAYWHATLPSVRDLLCLTLRQRRYLIHGDLYRAAKALVRTHATTGHLLRMLGRVRQETFGITFSMEGGALSIAAFVHGHRCSHGRTIVRGTQHIVRNHQRIGNHWFYGTERSNFRYVVRIQRRQNGRFVVRASIQDSDRWYRVPGRSIMRVVDI